MVSSGFGALAVPSKCFISCLEPEWLLTQLSSCECNHCSLSTWLHESVAGALHGINERGLGGLAMMVASCVESTHCSLLIAMTAAR